MHYVMVGIDPGLASTGFCIVGIRDDDLRNGDIVKSAVILSAGCITTKKSKSKHRRITADYARRIFDIVRHIQCAISRTPYTGESCKFLWAAESFSVFGCRCAASAQTLAVYGAVVGSCYYRGDAFITVAPSEGKRLTTGKKNASKMEVYEPVKEKLLAAAIKGYEWPDSRAEHVADAYATAIAGLMLYKRELPDE